MFRPSVKFCDKNRLKSIISLRKCYFSSSASDSASSDEKIRRKKRENHYDIVIVGGGMVGTTLASAIGNNDNLAGFSVLLLEASAKLSGFSGGKFSNRVSALNQNTRDLLDSIGAWDQINGQRFKSIQKMQVWDAISDAFITFTPENHPGDDLAYVVENDLIVDAALKTVEKAENVRIEYNSSIERCLLPESVENTAAVTLKDGKTFTCGLLVGADGAKSLVRRNMNVNTFEFPYNQFGVVATLELEASADGNSTAWQRFLPTGPVALLPLDETHSSLVWSTTTEQAKKLLKMSPEEFVKELNEAFVKNYKSDDIVTSTLNSLKNCVIPQGIEKKQNPPEVKEVMESSRAAFPLGFSHASTYVKTGVCLIGDAAHRIHPLAGQGVNLGFGDVKCLVGVLEDATLNGATLGDLGYLLKYERERLSHNVPMMLGVHGIQRLYNTDFAPVVALRTLGLQATQSIPLLKKLFMERAMY